MNKLKSLLLPLLMLAISGVVLFFRAMLTGFSHDEVQFVASAQTLAKYHLLPYRDYPFLHMPYQIFINALIVPLTEYHFLALRLLSSFFSWLTIAVGIIFIERYNQNASTPIRFLIMVLGIHLYLTNTAFVSLDGRALNHTVPTFISIISLWMLIRFLSSDRLVYLWMSGLLIGLAVGFRLWYAVLLLSALFGIGLRLPKEGWIAYIKKSSVFLIGVFLALIPVFWFFFTSPQKFLYGNLTYIRLNTLYREQLGHQTAMSLSEKIRFFFEYLIQTPSNLILYLIFLLALLFFARFYKSNRHNNPAKVVTLLFAISLLMASFSPTPLWIQYFFAPLPFIVLFYLLIFLEVLTKEQLNSKTAAFPALILILISLTSLDFANGSNLFNIQSWLPLQIHRFSRSLNDLQPEGKILTLSNLFVLEAKLDVYPQFNVGPFAWRTSIFLSPEKRSQLGIISPTELEDFLKKDPPDAILTGFESVYEGFTKNDPGGLESPFVDYAINNGYDKIELDTAFFPNTIHLWMKPSN